MEMPSTTPKAIIVIGPECSGTRFLTRVMMSCGCIGEDSHSQVFDSLKFNGDPIVWRRSVPHGAGTMSDISSMRNTLIEAGYIDVRVLVIHRDWRCNALSQVKAHYARNYESAIARVRDAHNHIARQIEELNPVGLLYYEVNYTTLVTRPQDTIYWLADSLGVSRPDQLIEVYDGDAQYDGRIVE